MAQIRYNGEGTDKGGEMSRSLREFQHLPLLAAMLAMGLMLPVLASAQTPPAVPAASAPTALGTSMRGAQSKIGIETKTRDVLALAARQL